MRTRPALLIPLALALTLTLAAQSPDTDIWDAARRGDIDRVEKMLEAGVDVDASTRYGATALTFAAEKGNLELVEFLLGKGADPNVRDTFYDRTPLDWALRSRHAEVAILLVRHGVSDIDVVLIEAVRQGQTELVRAIVERGPLYAYQKNAALDLARTAGNDELAALLEKAEVEPLETVDVDNETLRGYAGRYKIANGERILEVYEKDGSLDPRSRPLEPRGLG